MLVTARVYYGADRAAALAWLSSQHLQIIQDYGSFALIRIDQADLVSIHYRVRVLNLPPDIPYGAFQYDTSDPNSSTTPANVHDGDLPSGRSHHIFRMYGPLHRDWRTELQHFGVSLIEHLGSYHFLAEFPSDNLVDINNRPYIEAICPFQPVLKIHRTLLSQYLISLLSLPAQITITTRPWRARFPRGPEARQEGNVELVLHQPNPDAATLNAVRSAGATLIGIYDRLIRIYTNLNTVPDLAEIPSLRQVALFSPIDVCNDKAAEITKVSITRPALNLDGSNQVIGISDGGLDNGNQGDLQADLPADALLVPFNPANSTADPDGHGTHVAGSALGNGTLSNGKVKGMAPGANLVFQALGDDLQAAVDDQSSGASLFEHAAQNDVSIYSISWGKEYGGGYGLTSWRADTFTFDHREFLIVAAAGNVTDADLVLILDADPNNDSLASTEHVFTPGTARNVLTVGISENRRPELPVKITWTTPEGVYMDRDGIRAEADDPDQIGSRSPWNPDIEGRAHKPDVVAPGTWVLSTMPLDTTTSPVSPGCDIENLSRPGRSIFGFANQLAPCGPFGPYDNSAGQCTDDAWQYYRYATGSSMSTPIVAGLCALLRQQLEERVGHVPSAALIKALVINGAVPVSEAMMTYPGPRGGWGRVDIQRSLQYCSDYRVQYIDDLEQPVTLETPLTFDVFVSSSGVLTVTLVWRDHVGLALQNVLLVSACHMESQSVRYSAEFDDGTGSLAATDNPSIITNNVQKIPWDNPAPGHYRIEIEAMLISQPIPDSPATDPECQDFALVVSGAHGFSCNPSDIVQIIDRSGSMQSSGYIEPAKQCAEQLVDLLQINDRTGIVSFNDQASIDYALTRTDNQSVKEAMKSQIAQLQAGGLTDLRLALETGVTALGDNPEQQRALIFLSDGKHTTTTPPIDSGFLDELAESGMKVYTIALGPASDLEVLGEISARTGTGSPYYITSGAEANKMQEIYYDIAGDLDCGGLAYLETEVIGDSNPCEIEVDIDSTVEEAGCGASWEDEDDSFEMELEDPDGNRSTPDTSDIFQCRGKTHLLIRWFSPRPGKWKVRISRESPSQGKSWLVLAAWTDSRIRHNLHINRQYLQQGQLAIELRPVLNENPLTGGRGIVSITFPTCSVETLIETYREQLDAIAHTSNWQHGDADDRWRVALDQFAALKLREDSEDIFRRARTDIEFREVRKESGVFAGCLVYQAMVDLAAFDIKGPIEARLYFSLESPELGPHAFRKLIPITLPGRAHPDPENTTSSIHARTRESQDRTKGLAAPRSSDEGGNDV